jgi:hypothetical protein
MIRAGVRTDTMIGVTKFRIRKLNLAGSGNGPNIEQQLEHDRTRTFQEEYLAFLKKHGAHFDEKYLWD